MSTLIVAATAVSTNLDYNQVLQVIAQRMTKLVNAETCVISDFDAQHLKASPLVVFSTSQSEPDAVLPPERMDFWLISSVLKDSLPVQLHLDDPQLDPAGKSFLAQAGTATVLFFPLIVKDQTIGFVELGSKDSHRIFTAREITLLQTLGAHAAVSIQNARLYQSGYKEINLRALKLLRAGGYLVTCTCSYHVDEATFGQVLYEAAVDAGVQVAVVEKRMQGRDHPAVLGVPETYYLKCLILRRLD